MMNREKYIYIYSPIVYRRCVLLIFIYVINEANFLKLHYLGTYIKDKYLCLRYHGTSIIWFKIFASINMYIV